jgi:aspartyl-tRNA synthetase
VHNLSDTPPFPLDDVGGDKVNEDLRLTYRYLDLRRPKMRKNLQVRHRATKSIRDYFDSQEFIEVETPALFKSTPEGAREYLVPSRIHAGQFYALSQSPQQFKQILMVAGVEKYFQIARCFRDEDLRADRQMEFTQVDVEVSFIDREGIYALFEGMLKKVWKDVLNHDLPTPFPRIAYKDAMNRYGVDKPDVRFGSSSWTSRSCSRPRPSRCSPRRSPAAASDQGVQRQGPRRSHAGRDQGARGSREVARREGPRLHQGRERRMEVADREILQRGRKGRAHQASSAIERATSSSLPRHRGKRPAPSSARIRLDCGPAAREARQAHDAPDDWNFLWVSISRSCPTTRRRAATRPRTIRSRRRSPEDAGLLDTDPKKVRGQHYDVVLNGMELGGGSIRIHQPTLQKKVFEDVLKIPADVVESRFGYMLKAFTYGAPPHGGIAFGLDRMCALLCGTTSIRDVIAFPKTQKAQDLMAQSPTPVTAEAAQGTAHPDGHSVDFLPR